MKLKEFLLGLLAAILLMWAARPARKKTDDAYEADRTLKDVADKLNQTEVVLDRKDIPKPKPATTLEEAVERFNQKD